MTPTPPQLSAIRRIKRVGPLQLGKMMGIVYGAMGLFFLPFILCISAFASRMPQQQRAGMLTFGVGFAIFAPFLYGAMGFVLGVITAWVYNVAAKWIGGVEVEVE